MSRLLIHRGTRGVSLRPSCSASHPFCAGYPETAQNGGDHGGRDAVWSPFRYQFLLSGASTDGGAAADARMHCLQAADHYDLCC